MHAAELVFTYDTTEAAGLVADAVGQEVGEIEGDRTRVTVRHDGASFVVDVSADDLVALRAGLNTWSTLVEVAERAVRAAE